MGERRQSDRIQEAISLLCNTLEIIDNNREYYGINSMETLDKVLMQGGFPVKLVRDLPLNLDEAVYLKDITGISMLQYHELRMRLKCLNYLLPCKNDVTAHTTILNEGLVKKFELEPFEGILGTCVCNPLPLIEKAIGYCNRYPYLWKNNGYVKEFSVLELKDKDPESIIKYLDKV